MSTTTNKAAAVDSGAHRKTSQAGLASIARTTAPEGKVRVTLDLTVEQIRSLVDLVDSGEQNIADTTARMTGYESEHYNDGDVAAQRDFQAATSAAGKALIGALDAARLGKDEEASYGLEGADDVARHLSIPTHALPADHLLWMAEVRQRATAGDATFELLAGPVGSLSLEVTRGDQRRTETIDAAELVRLWAPALLASLNAEGAL